MAARHLLSYSVCLTALVLAVSCQDKQFETTTGEVTLELPADRFQYNNFSDPTNAVTTLGRVLFYDRNLSVSNTIACASCHKQQYGFADNQAFSQGFGGRMTTRNSMPVQNLKANIGFVDNGNPNNANNFAPIQGHLFWDGREAFLERLVLQPIGNHIEMGVTDAKDLTEKLSTLPYYSALFTDAFGSEEITTQNISTALTAFCFSINTNNTRFDQFNVSRFSDPGNQESKTPEQLLNPLEVEGMLLFNQKYDCNSCHGVQSTNGYLMNGTFANIGLDKDYTDAGRQAVTNSPADNGKFKIPSLRNVAYTAPYMHDGRFATLDEVIGHYSEGIADNPALDPKLKDAGGHAKSMNISEHEKQAIVAFLHTLSDESVISDPKFSNPFKVK